MLTVPVGKERAVRVPKYSQQRGKMPVLQADGRIARSVNINSTGNDDNQSYNLLVVKSAALRRE